MTETLENEHYYDHSAEHFTHIICFAQALSEHITMSTHRLIELYDNIKQSHHKNGLTDGLLFEVFTQNNLFNRTLHKPFDCKKENDSDPDILEWTVFINQFDAKGSPCILVVKFLKTTNNKKILDVLFEAHFNTEHTVDTLFELMDKYK